MGPRVPLPPHLTLPTPPHTGRARLELGALRGWACERPPKPGLDLPTSAGPRTQYSLAMSSLFATLRELQERHKRFVKKVHAFRIPLSPRGKAVAQVVYFSIPVVAGYYIMGWATDRAKEEIQYDDSSSSSSRTGGQGDDKARVMQAMRMTPSSEGAAGGGGMEQQIARQNQSLQMYLDTLKHKKG